MHSGPPSLALPLAQFLSSALASPETRAIPPADTGGARLAGRLLRLSRARIRKSRHSEREFQSPGADTWERGEPAKSAFPDSAHTPPPRSQVELESSTRQQCAPRHWPPAPRRLALAIASSALRWRWTEQAKEFSRSTIARMISEQDQSHSRSGRCGKAIALEAKNPKATARMAE